MKTTKCDRCGVEDNSRERRIRFVILEIKMGYKEHITSSVEYDICDNCKDKIDIDDFMLGTISKFIKEMPEEKG